MGSLTHLGGVDITQTVVTGLTVGAAVSSLVIDFFRGKIPNLITLPTVLLALILHTVDGGVRGLAFSMVGLLLGIAFLFIPYALGGMGAGDVKLLGAMGALQGPRVVVLIFLYTAIVGGIMALVIAIGQRGIAKHTVLRFRGIWTNLVNLVLTRPSIRTLSIPEELKGVQMPYGVALGLGTLLAIYLGRPVWL